MNSISKKIKNIDAEALAIGVYNFKTKNKRAQEVAQQRFKNHCSLCPHFVLETIIVFQIKDNEIPELSKMMCNECGCVLSYKLRQSIKNCKKWF
jgi:hypothetical protein